MKGRLAPTPSGYMHLGNAFAALLCWLSVRSQGGTLLLRVEDLDAQRSRPVYQKALLDDLLWLGLTWDEGPIYQSKRNSFYSECLQLLEKKTLLYPCFCTRAQLHTPFAPHESDGHFLYSGHCRTLSSAQAKAQARAGSMRVKVPNSTLTFEDQCQGVYSQNLQVSCGDFILRRSDGVYAYQLAAPADDGALHVTEVVRGQDLLSSTPRQIWLIQELGYTPPQYCHIPLLLAPDGRRLAKRDGDLELITMRNNGWRAEDIIGLLAVWAGLLPKWQAIRAQDLLSEFNWNKISKNNIVLPNQFDLPAFKLAIPPILD